MENLIMLIDDDQEELILFNEAIRLSGIRSVCTWAGDADHCYRLLGQVKPDIIFLDLNMPKKDGLVCLQELQQMPAAQQIPMILYSTSIPDKTCQEALNIGAVACVEKTNSLAKFSRQLKGLLERLHIIEA